MSLAILNLNKADSTPKNKDVWKYVVAAMAAMMSPCAVLLCASVRDTFINVLHDETRQVGWDITTCPGWMIFSLAFTAIALVAPPIMRRCEEGRSCLSDSHYQMIVNVFGEEVDDFHTVGKLGVFCAAPLLFAVAPGTTSIALGRACIAQFFVFLYIFTVDYVDVLAFLSGGALLLAFGCYALLAWGGPLYLMVGGPVLLICRRPVVQTGFSVSLLAAPILYAALFGFLADQSAQFLGLTA